MVTLRPIVIADAPAITAAVNQSRDALRRWMSWYRDDYDIDAATAWIEASLASAAAGTAYEFAILDGTNAVIGVVGLEDISEQSGRAMIGYWLATPMAGRQLGRQAVSRALAWARTKPDLRIVWAVVADANRASRRVLEVNGFRLVGTRGIDERGDIGLLYEVELHPTAA